MTAQWRRTSCRVAECAGREGAARADASAACSSHPVIKRRDRCGINQAEYRTDLSRYSCHVLPRPCVNAVYLSRTRCLLADPISYPVLAHQVDQHKASTLFGTESRCGAADSAGGPRDQDTPPRQIEG